MRGTKLVLSAGALVAVVTGLVIPLTPSSQLVAARQTAAPINCNLTQYKAGAGLTAAIENDALTVSWNGQSTSQLRARFAINGGTPTIRDLPKQGVVTGNYGWMRHRQPRTQSNLILPLP